MRLWILPLLLVVAGGARAYDCGYTIQMNSFLGDVKDNAQTNPHSATLTRGSGSNDNQCKRYQVYFGKGYSNSYQRRAYSGLNSLTYNIYRTVNQGNILKDYGDAGAGEFIDAQSPTQQTPSTITFAISIPDLDDIFTSSPSGVYTDVVPLNFYSVNPGEVPKYQTTRYLTLSFRLPRYAELSIVPENSSHNPTSTTYVMDFGNIEQNEELRADLWVKGNVGYGVMMSSMNGSKLVSTAGPSSTVPYTIRVGSGSYTTLSPAGNAFTMAQRFFGTNTQGERYNMRVKLGSFGQLEGGDYQDIITVTIQAY